MRRRILPPMLAVFATLLGALVPLLFNRTFYFIDDTQSGALGQWYEIGSRVLDGDWSLINPTVWQSGHYLAEGAWGIFSPVLWIIGVGIHTATNAVVYITIVKLVFFAVAAFGLWLLARTFGVAPYWAAAFAVAASLTGFTFYMDAASWVNGFMAWAIWPLAWALVRRCVFEARSPLLAFAACASLIGIGYVHGTLMLATVFVATIVEAFIRRHQPTIVRVFVSAALAGLFAVIVHLPGLLIAPVTGRGTGVANNGLMTVGLSGLAASAVPVASPQMVFFGTTFPAAPLLYISWLLPVLAFVRWRDLVTALRSRLSIVIVLGVALFAALLPSDFGPLRFPVRLMPYVSVGVLLVTLVGVSLAMARPLRRVRLLVAIGAALLSAWFAFVTVPWTRNWIALVTVIAIVGLVVVYHLLGGERILRRRSAGASGDEWHAKARPIAAALALIAVTVVMVIPQHRLAPRSPLHDYGSPTMIADYKVQFQGLEGDVLVLGGVADGVEHPEYWEETLMGNMFYLNDASVQNAYSAVYYPAYQGALCMHYNGSTCAESFGMAFTVNPATGVPLVDLMGVSAVQAVKSVIPEKSWSEVPDGWHIVEDTSLTRTIARDEPIDPAGSVSWTSDGTEVEVVHADAMGVRFRVDAVPEEGGTVVLSRLPWPGYVATGARIVDGPVDPLLLAVEIDGDSASQEIEVAYLAPGWQIQVGSGVLILLTLLGWTVLRRFRPRGGQRVPALLTGLREVPTP